MSLSLLIATEAACERRLRQAARLLADGEVQAADAALRQAQRLHADPVVEVLLGFIANTD